VLFIDGGHGKVAVIGMHTLVALHASNGGGPSGSGEISPEEKTLKGINNQGVFFSSYLSRR
jgi:hypothetical protein